MKLNSSTGLLTAALLGAGLSLSASAQNTPATPVAVTADPTPPASYIYEPVPPAPPSQYYVDKHPRLWPSRATFDGPQFKQSYCPEVRCAHD
jgi:hypothetical protein